MSDGISKFAGTLRPMSMNTLYLKLVMRDSSGGVLKSTSSKAKR